MITLMPSLHDPLELEQVFDTHINSLLRVLALRDVETEEHTQRVTTLTLILAQLLDVSETELVHIHRGALLHDIGKIDIPDSILHKVTPLIQEELAILQRHPTCAYELLRPIPCLQPALDIPYCHRERWDGSGYPRKLRGNHIPFYARLFAIVDVWNALLSDRPYRSPWSEERATEYILEQSGKHFDLEIATIFLENMTLMVRK